MSVRRRDLTGQMRLIDDSLRPNVPPLSSGRIRKRGGVRCRREVGGPGHDEARPSASTACWGGTLLEGFTWIPAPREASLNFLERVFLWRRRPTAVSFDERRRLTGRDCVEVVVERSEPETLEVVNQQLAVETVPFFGPIVALESLNGNGDPTVSNVQRPPSLAHETERKYPQRWCAAEGL